MGGGLLVLRPASGPGSSHRLRDAPPLVGTPGPSLHRWLRCQAFLRELADDVQLLGAPLTPSPDLERRDVRLDGARTPRQALQVFTDGLGLAPDPFLPGLPGALRSLVALVMLVPPE